MIQTKRISLPQMIGWFEWRNLSEMNEIAKQIEKLREEGGKEAEKEIGRLIFETVELKSYQITTIDVRKFIIRDPR